MDAGRGEDLRPAETKPDDPEMNKRILLVAVVLAVLAGGLFVAARPSEAQPAVTVYKTATCGCCNKWVEHLRRSGFQVTAVDVTDLGAVKARFGVPAQAGSCHTAVVGGYVVEGHVPAADVQRLLREKPALAGIAAPGMPLGSPGMESPNPQPYNVVGFTKGGAVAGVFARH